MKLKNFHWVVLTLAQLKSLQKFLRQNNLTIQNKFHAKVQTIFLFENLFSDLANSNQSNL